MESRTDKAAGYKETCMKKLMSVLVLALAAASVFAAGARETVTVNGKIAVTDGVPAISDGTKVWGLPVGPFYRLAFENGIKAGDTVKAEGYVMDRRGAGPRGAMGQNSRGTAPAASSDDLFVPTKVWVNGKEIDLSGFAGAFPCDPDGQGVRPGRGGRDTGGRRGGRMGYADRF